MDVQDRNFYPKSFDEMEVTAVDENGYPTTTEFSKDGNVVFSWTTTYNEDGRLTYLKVTIND